VLFVALSSLQGRPMQAAAEELSALGPVGLQLTPGCAPTPGFENWLDEKAIVTRTHHGFCWTAMRQPVWGDHGILLSPHDSVHPSRLNDVAAPPFWDNAAGSATIFETMYPGYVMGTGEELVRAMAEHRRIAVDVSHLFIQLTAGVTTEEVIRRVFEYDKIGEIHVSANNGKSDQHRMIDANTFGLSWATERAIAGIPLVLESYVHGASLGDRQNQVDVLLNRMAGYS
jgi:hypothetical protein